MQHEITAPAPLLNDDGSLYEAGYAKYPILVYDRSQIKARRSRIKEWDYYLIYNDRYAVALTADDNSYMGMMSVSFIDFEHATEITKSVIIPFTNGKIGLPPSSDRGDIVYKSRRVELSFTHEAEGRRLKVLFRKFKAKESFECDFLLTDEPRDSMVIATPFAEKKTAFYYNQKIIAMRASGTVYFDRKKYKFTPGSTFGLLDWGRGVWTYDNVWYWSAAQGMADGIKFGFNLGYGFGDTSAASENMLFTDGAAHKLEDVRFEIPLDENGKEKYLEPWKFTSSDGRLELDFVPIIDRKALTSLGIIMSDQHQVFGRFSGKVVLDGGRELLIKDLMGFAEKVRNKW
ncbi:MAG: DUF2804 domain-containing protein [Clostridiales bacterium]|nr:DUF2804 domain-containing protein [Clostridiales bacterium]